MEQINLLNDSRGWKFSLSRPQKICFSLLSYFLIGGSSLLIGAFLGNFIWHNHFLQQKPVVAAAYTTSPAPTLIPQGPSFGQLQSAQEEIERISRTPIKLTYQTKLEKIEEILAPEKIKSFLATSIWGNQVLVVINNQNFESTLAGLAQKINRESHFEIKGRSYQVIDRELDLAKLAQILRDELLRRQSEFSPQTEFDITSLVIEKPATDGKLTSKYLEVDLSQQKLYRWEKGKVAGQHIISTGKYGPTPVGLHKIMNKAQNAWSPPAQVWTPFWMAYSFNPNLGAYLGFHELPYWDNPDGERIRRPFDTLGVPVTGGCIQLNIGEAEEVYNWTEIGTPVLIHE